MDPFGRPRGLVQPDGSASAAAVALGALQARQWLLRRALAIAVAALLPLLGVALGLAARVAGTLRKYRQAYTYAAPAVMAMLVLVFIPFLYGIALSFTDANIYNSSEPIADIWVGLRNFRDILTDVAISRETPAGRVFNYQNFYWTLGFTIVWTVTNVAIGVTVGLALALALNTAGLRFRPIYRVLLIMPWAVPNYITALIWRGMFHKQFGVVNQLLLMVGGDSISWFEHPLTSFTAIVATNGWLSFPFMMVISLGALQSIPGELYEAARVDGASRWQQFTSITLPSLEAGTRPGGHPLGDLDVQHVQHPLPGLGRGAGARDRDPDHAGVQDRVRAVPLRLRGGVLDHHLRHPARLRHVAKPRVASRGGAVNRRQLTGDLPHFPLHVFVLLWIVIAVYPVLWVLSVAFSGSQSLSIVDLPPNPDRAGSPADAGAAARPFFVVELRVGDHRPAVRCCGC